MRNAWYTPAADMGFAPKIFAVLLSATLLAGSSVLFSADSPKSPGEAPSSPGDGSGGLTRVAPREPDDADPKFWGHLTDEEQARSVAALKDFALKASQTLKHPLRLSESRFFLLYSDQGEIQSARYLSLLDRMYAKLSELFGLEKGQNIWRGKGLVFVFGQIEDYRLYERLIENTDPGGSVAMTDCFGDGYVHTAFCRQPDAGEFEHLLVHESVHGFLHRYKSPRRIPSWANEGFADEAASELIPDRNRSRWQFLLARAGLERHKNNVGDFFTARHIDGWQYPIAETLAAWMVHQNRLGYLDFIKGIKDGQSWEESLQKNYKMSPDQLIAAYEKWLVPLATSKDSRPTQSKSGS